MYVGNSTHTSLWTDLKQVQFGGYLQPYYVESAMMKCLKIM